MNFQHSAIRTVIFDLDGTLIDAFSDIADAVNVPLRRRGYPTHSVAAITEFVGEGAGKLIERATPNIPADEIEEVRREMMDYYRQFPAEHAIVYTGILPLLEGLRARGLRLGILTNKRIEMTHKTLVKLGLTNYFDDVVGEDGESTPRKPHPGGLLAQIQRLGGHSAILVGDGIPDGKVAIAAGVPFVAVLWGTRTREQLAEFNPIAYAETVEELDAILHHLCP